VELPRPPKRLRFLKIGAPIRAEQVAKELAG
jgi:hypothetical protein